MKILITNTVALNVGDAAILEGIIKLSRSVFGNDAEIVVFDSKPEIASKYYPEIEFCKLLYYQGLESLKLKRPAKLAHFINFWRLYFCSWLWSKGLAQLASVWLSETEVKTLSHYSSADLVISTGGTYLVENYKIEPRILDFQVTLMMNCPLVLYTQSLGRFTLPRYRSALRNIFTRTNLILLRDRQSAENLAELSSESTKSLVTADAAFALCNSEALIKAKSKTSTITKPKVAISVRDWRHFKTIDPVEGRAKYLNSVKELCIYLVQSHQAEITFLSTCQGIQEYWLDDSQVAREIVAKLPKEICQSVSVNQDFHSPQDLIKILGQYDLVIATRMHMAILSLGAGTPVVPISYEFKIKELFTRLGQEQWILDIEEMTPSIAINSIGSYLKLIPKLNYQLFGAVEQEKNAAWKSIDNVMEIFNESKLVQSQVD